MKTTKRLIAGLSALAIAAALSPMSVFAEDATENNTIKQDSDNKSGTLTATYDVDAKYVITIPAAADIGEDESNPGTAEIEASEVMLKKDQKITVTLTGAGNTTTEKASVFNAVNGESTVKYTIGKVTPSEEEGGVPTVTQVALDDIVAEFSADGTQQLNFAKDADSAPTAAGAHTETLTFTVEVADAENIVDLSGLKVTEENNGVYEAQNGDVLTGTLSEKINITVADGANITLRNANITNLGNYSYWAGITCGGDATITLEDENRVKGGHVNYPGIYIAPGKTLTIKGSGSLEASSNGCGAGIGGGNKINCGNIIINSGTITATGGIEAAGIGACYSASCGNIEINGGTITATGGDVAAGIGSGSYDSSCGNITINGGTITATGGEYAAGIGGGYGSSCGDITITNTVKKVTATKGGYAPNSIGAGYFGTCGTVTIDKTEGAISASPYTYEPSGA